MALSFRSNSFLSLREQMDSLNSQGLLNTENAKELIEKNGLSVEDFKQADKEFQKSGLGYSDLETDLPGSIAGAVGKSVSGAIDFFDANLPKPVTNAIENTADTIGEYIPDFIKKSWQATFDPYTGDDTINTITRDVGSVLMPGLGFVKLGKYALGTSAISKSVGRFYNRLGNKSKFAVRNTAYGIPFAVAQTIVEDPRQNSFDLLKAVISDDPKALEAVMNIDDDPTAADYLYALAKNVGVDMALSLGLATGFKGIAKSIKAGKKSKVGQQITKLGVGKKITDFSKKYLTSRMGTDDVTLASLVKRDAAGKAALTRADGFEKDFKKAAIEEFGEKADDPAFRENIFNRYLQLKRDPLTNEIKLPSAFDLTNPDKIAIQTLDNAGGKTRQALDDMRDSITELQNSLKGKLRGTLGAVINKSAKDGTYLLRSYDFYDDPTFKKKLLKRIDDTRTGVNRDRVVENAVRYMQGQFPTASVEEIFEKLAKLAGQAPNKVEEKSFSDFVKSIADRNAIKITGKPLSKRTLKEPTIRELFGEVKNPAVNYVKTYEKLSLFKAENDFLEEVALRMNSNFNTRISNMKNAHRDAVQKGQTSYNFEGRTISTDTQGKTLDDFLREEAKKDLVDMGQVGRDRIGSIFGSKILQQKQMKNPLENIYASETYVKAIRDGIDVNYGNNKLLKAWLASKATSQSMKTVYNPTTHGRNIIGNVFIMLANGLLPSKQSLGNAMKVTASKLAKNRNNKELGEYTARLQEMGVIDSSIPAQVIRRNLNNVLKDPDAYLEKTMIGRYAVKKPQDLYQAEDDFFKIIHFERTKEALKKSFPQMDEAGIERMAAQRTRDLMPNYNLVPKAFKALRAAPVGDFLSFPAEMTRISKNLVKYTMEDFANSMKVIKDANGRVVSTQVTNPEMLKSASKRLAGMTTVALGGNYGVNLSKEIFNISDEEDNALRMLSPRWETNQERIYLSKINKDKNGHDGVDYINFGPIDPFAFLKSAAIATHDLLLNNKDYSPLETEKIALGMIENTLSPFIAPSMVTQSILDIVQGRVPDDPDTADFVQNVFMKGLSPFIPGFVPFITRSHNYYTSGVGKGFNTIADGEVDALAFAGLVRKRQDLTSGARFNFNPAFKEINGSTKYINNLLRDPNVGDDSQELMDGFVDVQKARQKGFKDIRDYIKLYNDLGFTDTDIIRMLSVNDLLDVQSKNVNLLEAANDNYFIPYYPNVDENRIIYKYGTTVPKDEMIKLYNQLEGARIE